MARPTHRGRRPPDERDRARAEGTLPPAFVAAAEEWLGDETADFLTACGRPPGLALRANGLKGGLPALRAALGEAATGGEVLPWWSEALLPPAPVAAALAAGVAARSGALYAQDPAALAAVAALDPQPGEAILDLCAAPGGKATAIADRLGATGLLVANDSEPRRARELARTLERWGLVQGIVLALTSERLAELAPHLFDRVLVDAPCSGEAMFARRDHAAGDWSPRHVEGCAARQRPLLETARRLVRPGGVLVYATCTFNPTENEGVIAAYLDRYPSDTLEDLTGTIPGAAPGRPDLLFPIPSWGKVGEERGWPPAQLTAAARLWPHRVLGAGHFVARLRVQSAYADAAVPTQRAGRRTRRPAVSLVESEEVAAVRSVVATVAPGLALEGTIVQRGDHAYLVPPSAPMALSEIALVPGLMLAERRGRTWRAAHALAMALAPQQASAIAALTDQTALAFLAGHPFTYHGDDGVALALWHGYPLGWGRLRDQTLTPLLPRGLRSGGAV